MFKLTKRSLPVVLALCLVACGSDPKNPDEGTPPAKLYEDAKDSMDSGNFEEAIRKYELLESRFPYGSYAQQAQLDIAYAYYRGGWGRFYHDDEWLTKGLEAVNRAIAAAPGGRVVVDDPDLQMHSADELKAELEAGLRRDVSDFNPFRVIRSRK